MKGLNFHHYVFFFGTLERYMYNEASNCAILCKNCDFSVIKVTGLPF